MNKGVCINNVREDWIPPEQRDEYAMKQNFGPDTANSFVYFPKEEIQTPEGYTLHFMRLPEDVRLYRGHKNLNCKNVNNPNSINCKNCHTDTWFSDYTTARLYGGFERLPNYMWVYETKKPLLLLNFLDKRNLDVIVDILVKKINSETINGMNENLGGYGTNNNTGPKKSINFMLTNPKMYLEKILDMTEYRLNEETIEKIWRTAPYIQEQYLRKNNSKNPPDTNIHELNLVSEEFGDQTALFRNSQKYLDFKILEILKYCLPTINFDGYYSPRYQSLTHTNNNYCIDNTRYYFHREIALFGTKDRVRRVPDSILNGCMNPTGGRRLKTIKRNKNIRKYKKTSKRRS
jgi:hypothetical protein